LEQPVITETDGAIQDGFQAMAIRRSYRRQSLGMALQPARFPDKLCPVTRRRILQTVSMATEMVIGLVDGSSRCAWLSAVRVFA
jgi:hypothetical protein